MSRAKRKSTDARLLDYMAGQQKARFGKTTPKQRGRIRRKGKLGRGFF